MIKWRVGIITFTSWYCLVDHHVGHRPYMCIMTEKLLAHVERCWEIQYNKLLTDWELSWLCRKFYYFRIKMRQQNNTNIKHAWEMGCLVMVAPSMFPTLHTDIHRFDQNRKKIKINSPVYNHCCKLMSKDYITTECMSFLQDFCCFTCCFAVFSTFVTTFNTNHV